MKDTTQKAHPTGMPVAAAPVYCALGQPTEQKWLPVPAYSAVSVSQPIGAQIHLFSFKAARNNSSKPAALHS